MDNSVLDVILFAGLDTIDDSERRPTGLLRCQPKSYWHK